MARPRAVLSTTCLKTRGVGAMHSTTYAASHAPLCLPPTHTGKESPCDAREEALIAPPSWPSSALAASLAPPAVHPLHSCGCEQAFAFLLEPQPNPIVDGYTDEMHCVTWG